MSSPQPSPSPPPLAIGDRVRIPTFAKRYPGEEGEVVKIDERTSGSEKLPYYGLKLRSVSHVVWRFEEALEVVQRKKKA